MYEKIRCTVILENYRKTNISLAHQDKYSTLYFTDSLAHVRVERRFH